MRKTGRFRNDPDTRKDALDSFNLTLELVKHLDVPSRAFPHVHDLLRECRTIAESVYGVHWESHVMEIYDRLNDEYRYLK